MIEKQRFISGRYTRRFISGVFLGLVIIGVSFVFPLAMILLTCNGFQGLWGIAVDMKDFFGSWISTCLLIAFWCSMPIIGIALIAEARAQRSS